MALTRLKGRQCNTFERAESCFGYEHMTKKNQHERVSGMNIETLKKESGDAKCKSLVML